jgi:hypothetical protein
MVLVGSCMVFFIRELYGVHAKLYTVYNRLYSIMYYIMISYIDNRDTAQVARRSTGRRAQHRLQEVAGTQHKTQDAAQVTGSCRDAA